MYGRRLDPGHSVLVHPDVTAWIGNSEQNRIEFNQNYAHET